MTDLHRRRATTSRPSGGYVQPAPPLIPAPDWIGYRHSLAHVFTRADVGDVATVCTSCGTETDVALVVHSPRCRP